MSDDAQSKTLKATIKAGGGYEAPWLTIQGDSPEELAVALSGVTEQLLQQIVDTTALFSAAHNVAVGVNSQQPAQQPAQAQAQQPSNVTTLKTCAHGVRVKKTGTNSRGPWTGYYCPQPRNAADRCDPIYE